MNIAEKLHRAIDLIQEVANEIDDPTVKSRLFVTGGTVRRVSKNIKQPIDYVEKRGINHEH